MGVHVKTKRITNFYGRNSGVMEKVTTVLKGAYKAQVRTVKNNCIQKGF